MKCEEFQLRLDRSLDEHRDPESDWSLISHAAQCQSCGQQLNDQQRLVDAMGVFHAPHLPDSFAEDVVARACEHATPLRPADRKPIVETRRGWFAGVSLAVALLVSGAVLTFVASPSGQPREGQFFSVAQVGNVSPIEPVRNAAVVPAAHHVSSSFAAKDPLRRESIMSALEPLTSLPRIESGEIPGVRPLVNSLDVTISLLKQTIPRHSNSTRKPPTTSQRGRGPAWGHPPLIG